MTSQQILKQESADLFEAYLQLNDTQRLVLRLYVKRLAAAQATKADATPIHDWVREILQRYQRGEELTLADLEL